MIDSKKEGAIETKMNLLFYIFSVVATDPPFIVIPQQVLSDFKKFGINNA